MTRIAFDTETRGFSWFDGETAFLGSWADARNEYVANLLTPEGVGQYVRALRDADELVAHNFSFDCHQTRETVGLDLLTTGAQLHDTDLMSRVLYPEGNKRAEGDRAGHKLKDLGVIFIRPDAGDSEKVMEKLADQAGIKLKDGSGGYYDFWRAYPEQMETYAKEDARITYDLYDRFQRDMVDGALRCYELERDVLPVLTRAENKGTAVDQGAVETVRQQYIAQRDETYAYLEKELGEAALGGNGSEEALLEALQKLGVELYRTTPTGQLATNHFALQEFEDDYPQIQKLFDWRQANKFLNTYIEPMVGREVIHPSFAQCGAWTGRMSCRRPNMQNIPVRAGSEVRAMFVPRPGYSFVVCDYDSIEIRLLAWYLGDEAFRTLVADERYDAMSWMAAQLWGNSPEYYAKGGPQDKKRTDAKQGLYAVTYGAGGGRLTDMFKLDPGPWFGEDHPAILEARANGRDWPKVGWQNAQGRALANKIRGSLPGYRRLNKRVREKIEDLGYVNTLWGRKQVVNREKSYVGLNALIQGSAADIMKQGLVNVDEVVRPLGATPLLVVHDEVVVETPTENAQEVLRLTNQALREAYDLNPPLEVTGKIVHHNYAEAK